jgi:hypothetical protein
MNVIAKDREDAKRLKSEYEYLGYYVRQDGLNLAVSSVRPEPPKKKEPKEEQPK